MGQLDNKKMKTTRYQVKQTDNPLLADAFGLAVNHILLPEQVQE